MTKAKTDSFAGFKPLQKFRSERETALDAIDRLIEIHKQLGDIVGTGALTTAREWVNTAIEDHRYAVAADRRLARAYQRGRETARRETRAARKTAKR